MSNIFYHRGSIGDIIYSLPTIISAGGGTLVLGKDEHYKFLKTLLEKQPSLSYILRLPELSNWSDITHNLDVYRPVSRKNPSKHLSHCHIEPFGLSYDFTKPWLRNIQPKTIRPIIINRSGRYRGNKDLDWKVLKDYPDQCVFIGHGNEYRQFVKETGVNVEFYQVEDALDVAQIIKGSKLFIGNQSSCFAIAESLKHSRVLEVCDTLSNCIPFTSNGKMELMKEYIDYCLNQKIIVSEIIPDIVIKNNPIIKLMYSESDKPTVFLPHYGEYGAFIDKYIKIVNYNVGKHKIVCCRRGEEVLFPTAKEFYYEWNEVIEDKYKWGEFTKSSKFEDRGEYNKTVKKLETEINRIKGILGDKNYIGYYPRNKDSNREYINYTHLFRIDYNRDLFSKEDVDVVICPRKRNIRSENNFTGWDVFIQEMRKNGIKVGCIGKKETSMICEGSYKNSWDSSEPTKTMMSMLMSCKLYVGLDTGPSHLASLLSVPMIIFSPCEPKWYASNFMKNITTNYFRDLGINTEVDKVIKETLRFLGK